MKLKKFFSNKIWCPKKATESEAIIKAERNEHFEKNLNEKNSNCNEKSNSNENSDGKENIDGKENSDNKARIKKRNLQEEIKELNDIFKFQHNFE